uniref:Uncharacterized protein n=1 Tax=Ananas comosus var. bracteatus TaxID=296719 RepID=A0A6V7PKW6_ANACO|nr:unnamed protein product [Ananas comosus var. bracteatus]
MEDQTANPTSSGLDLPREDRGRAAARDRGVDEEPDQPLVRDLRRAAEGGASTCKVELKPWPFWSKKGYKSLDVADDDDECSVDVFWDLRSAKFSGSGSPEPTAGYYVALVCDEEVILLVGDGNKDAYKRTKSRPCLEEAVLVSKRENVFGRKSFAARARKSRLQDS